MEVTWKRNVERSLTMNKVAISILVASLAAAAQAAPAQTRSDPLAAQAIHRGELAVAEHRLDAERRVYRDRPEILLNLAAVYARTGRSAEARDLYQKVLARDDVLMDLDVERTASSHRIAQSGLQRLAYQPDHFARK
jgi:tetratricopeptide (TPR) repeat protein